LTLEERIGTWERLPSPVDAIAAGQTLFVLRNRGLAAARNRVFRYSPYIELFREASDRNPIGPH
jgi:hypothetical protein